MATASVTNTFTNGTTADATEVNTNFSDLVTFLNTNVVHVDGSKAMTAALAMGSNKITGLADGTVATDAATFGQLSDGVVRLKTFVIPGEAAVGDLTAQWYHGRRAITIVDVFAYCDSDGDPTGAATVLDVDISGTSAFPTSTKPQIAAAADEDTQVRVPDTTAVGATAPITVGVDSVGTTGAVNTVIEIAYTID